jgi:teichoic acid transport system ATP-binding protein
MDAAETAGSAAVMTERREGDPTVVVDDVHLIYRVAGKKRKRTDAASALFRLVTRQQQPGMREVHAVRGVSLTAHRGEAVGIIGPNGSGKSTLLRGIAGLMPITAGQIYVRGEPSLLGVGAALIDDLPGSRNIELGCLAMGMTPAEVRERFDDIVAFADIGEFIDMPMRTYSSGMNARLRFAIAASKTHDILLIDEALATGDAEFRRKSEKRILELVDQAGTIFLVSHGLQVIRDTCSRVVWLEKGQIVMDGPTEDVVDAYEDKYDPQARTRAATHPAESSV